MPKGNLFSSIFLILLSVYVCWQSIDLKIGSFSKPGPGLYSLLSSLILGFLAVILLISSRASKRAEKGPPHTTISWKPIVCVMGALLGFTLFLKTLGFTPATFLFIGVLLRGVARKTWTTSALAALGIALGAYTLFELGLQSQLPRGPVGFFGF